MTHEKKVEELEKMLAHYCENTTAGCDMGRCNKCEAELIISSGYLKKSEILERLKKRKYKAHKQLPYYKLSDEQVAYNKAIGDDCELIKSM